MTSSPSVRSSSRSPLARPVLGAVLGVAALLLSACAVGNTGPAADVTATSATLRGTVDSDRTQEVRYWFAYGTTTAYGSETPHRTLATERRAGYPVSEDITGLQPATTYHFQLCAQAPEYDAFCGEDRTFVTAADEPPPTALSITADPALYPAFDPEVGTYVTRCANSTVTLRVAAPPNTQVAIDGRPARSGRFSTGVALREGQRFGFATVDDGAFRHYDVRCLPADFPQWTHDRTGASALDFALVTPLRGSARYLAMFDPDGVPVYWYRAVTGPLDAKLLADDTLAFERGATGAFGQVNDAAYEIRRLDGTLVRTLRTVGSPTDFHDLQQLSNGNFLILTYRRRDHVDLSAHGGPSDATVLDAEIQELTPGGQLVWTWNSKNHIALSETDRWWPTLVANPSRLLDGTVVYDITHINAVEPDGDGLLISLRHTDAIYRISRADGRVLWKVGGTTTPQSLTVSGDGESRPLGGQHDVRRLGDGTVSVHDNGTGLGRAPRSLRFRIDPAARTAQRVELIADPDVPTSPCCGSARKLGAGGWLIDWGHFNGDTIGEYRADGSRIFRLRFPETLSYRAFPVTGGRLSRTQLRTAMDGMYPR